MLKTFSHTLNKFTLNYLYAFGENTLINRQLDQKMDESTLLIYSLISVNLADFALTYINRHYPSGKNLAINLVTTHAICLISGFAGKYFTELTCKKPITTKQALITSSFDTGIRALRGLCESSSYCKL